MAPVTSITVSDREFTTREGQTVQPGPAFTLTIDRPPTSHQFLPVSRHGLVTLPGILFPLGLPVGAGMNR